MFWKMGGTCGLYAIVHFLRSPARLTYENSIVKKGLLELAANGSRKFWLVDVESISDVCFGVPDLSGHTLEVLASSLVCQFPHKCRMAHNCCTFLIYEVYSCC